MNRSVLLLISILVLASSCSKTESDNIKTKAFYASYSVQSENSNSGGVTCYAQFQIENELGSYIELSNGDAVSCNGTTMNKSVLGSIVTYSASLSYAGTVSFDLVRTGEGTYTSTVDLPAPISFSNITDNMNVLRGATFQPSWSVSSVADYMTVDLNFKAAYVGETKSFSRNKTSNPDAGSVTYTALETAPDAGDLSCCTEESLLFRRFRNGTMSPDLSGQIVGIQRKQFSVNVQ